MHAPSTPARAAAGRVTGRRTRLAAVVLTATVLLVATGCATQPGPAPTSPSASAPSATAAAEPAGIVDGAFQIGDGATVVDLYTDSSCPHCKLFDAAASDELQSRIDAGEITLRLHPINYVSAKRSDTTDFSTRTMNLLAVASDHGHTDLIPAIYSAIVEKQPDTADGAMPTTDEMIAIAEGKGLTVDAAMRAEIENGRFNEWVKKINDTATANPLPSGDSFVGVPTLIIDGSAFDIREDGTDLERLQAEFAR